MSARTTRTSVSVSPYEENWRPLAPRPEWERPGYWEQFRGLVPGPDRPE